VIRPIDGSVELGTACTSHADERACHADSRNACLWTPSRSACRGIAGGQAVSIVAVSGMGTGRIGGGVLRTGPIGQTQLELGDEEGGAYGTQSYGRRVGARIDGTSLTTGQLGGWVSMENLQTFAGVLSIGGGPTFTPDQLEALVRPDLEPDATGHCTRVSAGFAFDALAVEVVP